MSSNNGLLDGVSPYCYQALIQSHSRLSRGKQYLPILFKLRWFNHQGVYPTVLWLTSAGGQSQLSFLLTKFLVTESDCTFGWAFQPNPCEPICSDIYNCRRSLTRMLLTVFTLFFYSDRTVCLYTCTSSQPFVQHYRIQFYQNKPRVILKTSFYQSWLI